MIVHSRIAGDQLAGNLLGDPTERDVFVYLPPGYEESDARYPTVYLLHALGSSAELEVTPAKDGQRWHPPLEDVLDPVFGRLGAPPMIVVIPDGICRYGCGQWVDSPVSGNFEQYLLHDVIPYVDAAYRTIPSASSRGVFGFSSGGFGAWKAAGGTVEQHECDLLEDDAAEEIIRAAVERMGRVDILVNNAGANRREPIFDVSRTSWDLISTINLRVPYELSRAAARDNRKPSNCRCRRLRNASWSPPCTSCDNWIADSARNSNASA